MLVVVSRPPGCLPVSTSGCRVGARGVQRRRPARTTRTDDDDFFHKRAEHSSPVRELQVCRHDLNLPEHGRCGFTVPDEAQHCPESGRHGGRRVFFGEPNSFARRSPPRPISGRSDCRIFLRLRPRPSPPTARFIRRPSPANCWPSPRKDRRSGFFRRGAKSNRLRPSRMMERSILVRATGNFTPSHRTAN